MQKQREKKLNRLNSTYRGIRRSIRKLAIEQVTVHLDVVRLVFVFILILAVSLVNAIVLVVIFILRGGTMALGVIVLVEVPCLELLLFTSANTFEISLSYLNDRPTCMESQQLGELLVCL